MKLVSEIRARARLIVGPVVGVCLAAYFAYHVVQGDRGLIAWWQLGQEVEAARALKADAAAERRALEHRVQLLSHSSLDRDMLDERARVMLNFGLPDEIVIFT